MFERYREIQQRREAGDSEVGFTLIELLIVIIVLGILAAIVIFSLTGVTGQSEAAACASDAKTVETAVSAYQAENNAWPATLADSDGRRRIRTRAVPSCGADGYDYGQRVLDHASWRRCEVDVTTPSRRDDQLRHLDGPGCLARPCSSESHTR